MTTLHVPAIIGLAGPANVGKDTMGRHLAEIFREVRGPTRVESLAAPLYEMVAFLTGVSVDNLQRRTQKDRPFKEWMAAPPAGMEELSPRAVLQWLGEGMRERFGEDVWCNRLRERTATFRAAGGTVVVTDVRHPNEARMCSMVVELAREGVQYACDHVSATPLAADLIHVRYLLRHGPRGDAQALSELISEAHRLKLEA
jgi:hypothetical protein